ncbi:hypothetical protein G6F40_016360 [Rhizopus arrhizus]|nr:hypothetical protein G6F40_016360 [Rhizopus arrhizus]
MRVEVIRELGAAVQEIDAVQADGADQPVLGIGQRPALVGAARHVAGDLLAQGVFRDVAPAGVFDHARQREVSGSDGTFDAGMPGSVDTLGLEKQKARSWTWPLMQWCR